jgi:MoxR-like ATPase
VYTDTVPEPLKLTLEELDEWNNKIDAVELSEEVLNVIQLLKYKIEEHNARPNNEPNRIPIFDRRWKKVVRLLRTSAFLNGRSTVDLMDCFLMVHCLWTKPDQLELLQEMVAETIRKHGYSLSVNLSMIRQELDDFEEEVEKEIHVPHTIAEEHPVVVQDEYFRLEKAEQKFEGILVSAKHFRELGLEEEMVINLYDEELNLRNRLKARKGVAEHTIELFHNSVKYTYPLATKKVEKTQMIRKTPHPVVLRHWDERHRQLQSYIQKQEERLHLESPAELDHLRGNLFVPANLSEIVESNHKEVVEALEQLQLRLEKVQFSYQKGS